MSVVVVANSWTMRNDSDLMEFIIINPVVFELYGLDIMPGYIEAVIAITPPRIVAIKQGIDASFQDPDDVIRCKLIRRIKFFHTDLLF